MILRKYFIVFVIVFTVGLSYGLFVSTYKIFPYNYFDEAKKILLSEKEQPRYTMNEFIYDVDVNSLIHINDEQDIIGKRNKLIDYIWNGQNVPNSQLPQKITTNIVDSRYGDLENLQNIDKIEYEADYGINSVAYIFFPKNTNNKLVIYHQGHDGDFVNGKNTISFFLKNDYTVLAFSMPLLGMNNQPIVDLPNFGPIILKSHDHLKYIESDKLRPIKFFFEPIFVSLNYMEKNYNFDAYYMVGISGGAWMSMYYPAIDVRISQSYPVAGPYPLYLRSNYDVIGDYETELPDLIRVANELEVYVMSSYGENRKLMQIYNKYDSCCWDGEYFKTYANVVKNKIKNLGKGSYEVYLDDTHRRHQISNHALNVILESMSN